MTARLQLEKASDSKRLYLYYLLSQLGAKRDNYNKYLIHKQPQKDSMHAMT